VGKPSLNAAQPYAKAEGRVFLMVLAYPGCPGTKAVVVVVVAFYYVTEAAVNGVEQKILKLMLLEVSYCYINILADVQHTAVNI